MSELNVDTDKLRANANRLKEKSGDARKLAEDIGHLSAGINKNKYQGQFAQKVQSILDRATYDAGYLQMRMNELSNELTNLAEAIEEVNNNSFGNFYKIGIKFEEWGISSTSATALRKYTNLSLAELIVGLGGFFSNISGWFTFIPTNSEISYTPIKIPRTFISVNTNLQNEVGGTNKNALTVIKGERTQILGEAKSKDGDDWVNIRLTNGKTGWIRKDSMFTATRLFKTNISGENVRAGVNESDKLYYRLAYDGSTLSDCTWFAAAAIKEESHGKIDLDNNKIDWRSYPEIKDENGNVIGRGWGSGGDWSSYAKNLIKNYDKAKLAPSDRIVRGVDSSPEAGDVLCDTSMGHVAFVEETWISEDKSKIVIVVSEENAGSLKDNKVIGSGSPIRNPSDKITVPGEDNVKRYRRTIVFDNTDPGGIPKISNSDIEFIHFNYP